MARGVTVVQCLRHRHESIVWPEQRRFDMHLAACQSALTCSCFHGAGAKDEAEEL
jgi:hypothetical protein